MLKIEDIKNNQVFYAMDNNGEPYSFKAWSDATLVNGSWIVEATDRGDYSYTFDEGDEAILFVNDSLDD